MYPWLYRHEGKPYSTWQEHRRGTWVDVMGAAPEAWLPASTTDPD